MRDFLENIFLRLAHTKKLRKAKIKVWRLSPESSNVRSPLPDSVEQVWPDPAKMVGFQPDSFGSGQIRPNLARAGRIPAILARSSRNLVCRLWQR